MPPVPLPPPGLAVEVARQKGEVPHDEEGEHHPLAAGDRLLHWRCTDCAKVSEGFAFPYGMCPACGDKLAVLDARQFEAAAALEAIRTAFEIELGGMAFYTRAAAQSTDPALRHLFGRLLVVELARDHIGQVNRPVRRRGRLGHSGRARLAGSVHARALALCIGGGIVHVGVFSWPRPVLAGSASARLAVSAKASSSDRLACAGDSSSMPARADMGEST